MTVKYLIKKPSGLFYFRRGIPEELRAFYNNKRELNHSLKTYSKPEAIKRAKAYAKLYDKQFQEFREGKGVRDQAVKFLALYGLIDAPREEQPGYMISDCGMDDYCHGYEELVRDLEEQYREDTIDPDGPCGFGYIDHPMPPHEERALDIVTNREPITLTAAAESALKRAANNKRKLEIERSFKRFTSKLKADLIKDLRRANVQKVVDEYLQAGEVSFSTLKKEIGIVKKAVSDLLTLREKDHKIPNPFDKVKLNPVFKNPKKRHTFAPEELLAVQQMTKSKAHLPTVQAIGLLINTGCRLSEVAGIKLESIVEEAETPHLVIQPEDSRTLKNSNSERVIPLFGLSLEIAKQIKQEAQEGQVYAFPQWIKQGKLNNNTSSASVNKKLKEASEKGTSHSFRHTMNTRLYEAGLPQPVIEEWLGWTNQKMINHYGLKEGLRQLSQASKKLQEHEATKEAKYKAFTPFTQ